jgi:hypothetical protein
LTCVFLCFPQAVQVEGGSLFKRSILNAGQVSNKAKKKNLFLIFKNTKKNKKFSKKKILKRKNSIY